MASIYAWKWKLLTFVEFRQIGILINGIHLEITQREMCLLLICSTIVAQLYVFFFLFSIGKAQTNNSHNTIDITITHTHMQTVCRTLQQHTLLSHIHSQPCTVSASFAANIFRYDIIYTQKTYPSVYAVNARARTRGWPNQRCAFAK